jgi:hypothetical protein
VRSERVAVVHSAVAHAAAAYSAVTYAAAAHSAVTCTAVTCTAVTCTAVTCTAVTCTAVAHMPLSITRRLGAFTRRRHSHCCDSEGKIKATSLPSDLPSCPTSFLPFSLPPLPLHIRATRHPHPHPHPHPHLLDQPTNQPTNQPNKPSLPYLLARLLAYARAPTHTHTHEHTRTSKHTRANIQSPKGARLTIQALSLPRAATPPVSTSLRTHKVRALPHLCRKGAR